MTVSLPDVHLPEPWSHSLLFPYEEGLIRAEKENEAKHRENQRFFKESLEKALIEINKEKEKCLREYLEELKDIAVAVAEKVIHISLRSSGSVISRMIEAETEKLQKMDWVKIYMITSY